LTGLAAQVLTSRPKFWPRVQDPGHAPDRENTAKLGHDRAHCAKAQSNLSIPSNGRKRDEDGGVPPMRF
jgi:hypothetical protein